MFVSFSLGRLNVNVVFFQFLHLISKVWSFIAIAEWILMKISTLVWNKSYQTASKNNNRTLFHVYGLGITTSYDRFFGIRDFPYLKLEIREFKARIGKIQDWKYARELEYQK